MNVYSHHIMEKLRASAWTTPAIYVFFAIIFANLGLFLDRHYLAIVFEHFDFLKIASVADARALVGTIATSMLAVAGVSFSSIMVTMTLASQQFGPRILRNFLKDSTSQRTLGVLIGTFVYCLLIMRGIRSYDGVTFVPQFSTLMAVAFAIISLGVFIHFIHHILNDIQAESVVADAYRGLEETIHNQFPEPGSGETEHPTLPTDTESWSVIANMTGYVQAIDYTALATTAKAHDALLVLETRPGAFISDHKSIVKVIDGPSFENASQEFIKKIQSSFLAGPVRTPEQDYEHGVRQLVEVALRSLSPGVNDPFTAMDALDYLGAALQEAFQRPLPESAFRDDDGNLRLLTKPSSHTALVEAAFNQIRQSSVEKCDVSCRLLEVLTAIAQTAKTEEQQEALLQQAVLVNQNTIPTLLNDFDRESITVRFQQFLKTCDLFTPFS